MTALFYVYSRLEQCSYIQIATLRYSRQTMTYLHSLYACSQWHPYIILYNPRWPYITLYCVTDFVLFPGYVNVCEESSIQASWELCKPEQKWVQIRTQVKKMRTNQVSTNQPMWQNTSVYNSQHKSEYKSDASGMCHLCISLKCLKCLWKKS